MTIDRDELFRTLAELQPTVRHVDAASISVPALVAGWLDAGPAVCTGIDRDQLDALCRQIDVRAKVSAAYREGFKRTDPEEPAPAVVVAGLVAVLLANASGVDAPNETGALNDGWALKCINSAFKAIEIGGSELVHRPELTAWAMESLDRARVPAEEMA